MFLRIIVGLLLVVATATAGCAKPSNRAEPDSPGSIVVVRIPEGAYDSAAREPFYLLESIRFDAPAVLRWINDDTAFHRVIGSARPFDGTPAWVAAALGGHAGDDHDGGAAHDHNHEEEGAASVVFDIDLDAGQMLDVPLDLAGVLDIHCHPHPWMADVWMVTDAQPAEYAVAVGRLLLAGEASGTAEAAHGGLTEVAWRATAPNLAAVNATLTWDDSEDDGPGGEATNQPDTFRLALRDPGGRIVAESRQTARTGQISIQFEAPLPAWPKNLTAKGAPDAVERLRALAPDNRSLIGDWTVQVTLEEAPGAVAGQDLHDLPTMGDGRQSWNLNVSAIHAWAEPLVSGTRVVDVAGLLELIVDGEPHTH